MIEMKYVVVDSFEYGEELFIFPTSIEHDRFAEVLYYIRPPAPWTYSSACRKAVSAGFTDGETCYGRSELLDLDSRKEDTVLLSSYAK